MTRTVGERKGKLSNLRQAQSNIKNYRIFKSIKKMYQIEYLRSRHNFRSDIVEENLENHCLGGNHESSDDGPHYSSLHHHPHPPKLMPEKWIN